MNTRKTIALAKLAHQTLGLDENEMETLFAMVAHNNHEDIAAFISDRVEWFMDEEGVVDIETKIAVIMG